MRLKYIIFLFLFVPADMQFTQLSFAQSFAPPLINANPLPVGSGARAIGQGGAFIAVADDATAASWNPGALIQLEKPECSFVGSFLSTQQDFDPGDTDLSLGDEAVSRGDVNYASIAYPFRILKNNFVAALNYQQIYDFHMNLDFDQKIKDTTPPELDLNQKIDFKSEGGVGALTPAISMLVLPKLSIGVAVNFFTDEFLGDYAWKETTHARGAGKFAGNDVQTAYDIDRTFKNFQAVNVTAGLLWDVWRKEEKLVTFGAVYKSPYTAKVDRITDFTSEIVLSENVYPGAGHEREHFEVDYPMSAGVGLGLRYNDALSFSMDITWTDWSAFEQKSTDTGKKSFPLGGQAQDTYGVKCGTEYLIFRKKIIVPVRGGLFYDPRPSQGDPTDVYGCSAGSGITFKRFSIDGAYQFRLANNVDGGDFGLEGTHFDLNELLFLASVIVYF